MGFFNYELHSSHKGLFIKNGHKIKYLLREYY